LRERLKRHRVIRAYLRRAMIAAAASSARTQAWIIRSTPASKFPGGETQKRVEMVKAMLSGVEAMTSAAIHFDQACNVPRRT